MNPTNTILLNNLRQTYGTVQQYDAAIAKLPWEVRNALAVPPEVLNEFRSSTTTATQGGTQQGEEAAQGNEESNAPKMGCCTVHSLLNEPGLLLPVSDAVYIGRANKPQQLRQSPLANLSPMRSKSEAERNKVCDEDIHRLIQCLQVQDGKAWEEIKRLAKKVRKGEHVKLLCWCAPKRCHGDALALVIQALAEKQPVESIAEKLRALLPAKQSQLF